ncbi:MAG TPA: hypothetical protein VE975_08140 [Actinomycetota bacterium]|nr:hypothetical protein [Actinomycetota bacterium]
MRKTIISSVVGLVLILLLALAAVGSASPSRQAVKPQAPAQKGLNIVQIAGGYNMTVNSRFQSTLKFNPGDLTVKQGAVVTWIDGAAVPVADTVTIVPSGALPATPAGVFHCLARGQLCSRVWAAHQVARPNLFLNRGGPGFGSPGDSILIQNHKAFSVKITAPAGSTLRYMSVTHPWMQGTIKVTK